MISQNIPKEKLEFAFSKVGWIKKNSKSGKFDIWVNPKDSDSWTVIPTDEQSEDYKYYLQRNVLLLLNLLSLENNEFNQRDLISQLNGFNYKIINKIDIQEGINTIPYEIGQNIPQKTIDSFRIFYNLSNKGKNRLTIEDFQLNHTIQGSFIIPISVAVKEDNSNQGVLFDMPVMLNILLRKYLTVVDSMVKLPIDSSKKFATNAYDQGVDSRIVKEFLSTNDSIAKYKEKYSNQIKDYSITSTSSPFLDFNLDIKNKSFPIVDLGPITVLSEEYISALENLEIKDDDSTIDKHGVNIDVIVDQLSYEGTVKFSVLSIENEDVKKAFKAWSVKLPKSSLDICTDVFKSRDVLTIKGDITKQKGRPGELIPESLKVEKKQESIF